VAEASAFIAMSHFGYDTSEYSFPYVVNWAENMNRIRQNLGAVQKISSTLIQAIEGEERGSECTCRPSTERLG
jgi:hypothetical protein